MSSPDYSSSSASWPLPISPEELDALIEASTEVQNMALEQAGARPMIATLIEEFAAVVQAAHGRYDSHVEHELKQLAATCINLLWQLKVKQPVGSLLIDLDNVLLRERLTKAENVCKLLMKHEWSAARGKGDTAIWQATREARVLVGDYKPDSE